MISSSSTKKQVFFNALAAVGLVLFLHLLFMLLSGQSFGDANGYNTYSKQAAAWLSGRLDLGQDYPWLELAIYEGRYYVSFPPFPSYFLLPFVLFFGENTPDLFLTFAVTGLGAAFASRIAGRCRKEDPASAILLPFFLYCGTAVWQITVDGSVWFFAQNLALMLTLASLYFALQNRRGLSLFLLVAAVGCRPFNIFAFPILLYLLYAKTEGDSFFTRCKKLLFHRFGVWLPAVILAASFLALNWVRFGNPFDFGRAYLPEFVRSPDGQFSMHYFVKNLPCLYRLPTLDPQSHRLVFPAFDGMNILLSFPILIWYLWRLGSTLTARFAKKQADSRILWLNAVLILLAALQIALFLTHRTMGGCHYGNRYVGDTLPLFYLGLCMLPCCSRKRGSGALNALLFFSLLFGGAMLSVAGVLQVWF